MCRNADEDGDFGHIGGLTVRDFSDVPPELSRVRIPARCHAVFARRGHVSAVCGTIDAIWNKWLPVSGRIVADAPSFERYDGRFDPRTCDRRGPCGRGWARGRSDVTAATIHGRWFDAAFEQLPPV